MSGLDNLNTRLNYAGGKKQESRMQSDKLRALRKALIYSYQAATAILPDGREFRCLINKDKLKQDYEDKILSIPYEDICLNKEKTADKTTQGYEKIELKPGDVFCWKETNTYWLIYLHNIEEDAYFRAEIRRCNLEIEINKNKYKVYVHGSDATSILWHSRRGAISWNDLNYDASLLVTKNEETEAFFHRFQILKLNGKQYEVQIVDGFSTDGILEVHLKEWYQNTIQDKELEAQAKKEEETPDIEIDETLPLIKGDAVVYPYDTKEYTIQNAEGGRWQLSNNKARIVVSTDKSVAIEVTATRSATTDLIYMKDGEVIAQLPITIKSL